MFSQRIAVAVADYYSSLSDSDAEEHARWGEFAMAQWCDSQRSESGDGLP
jgi:hypothetical protein